MRRTIIAMLAVAALSAPALARDENPRAKHPLTLAVIGDTPYGAAQADAFPELIERINDAKAVDLALHVGDVKNGSSVCSDEYFDRIAGYFATFADPLVYTPGDNEWTDCHRANNGGYVPTERLEALREAFFPEPGRTLGEDPRRVDAQLGFPENVLWRRSHVVFSAVHVVGSNNGLASWFGGAETQEQTVERLAEVEARTEAALDWIDATFDVAERNDTAGVLIAMQADMWDGAPDQQTGFAEIKEAIGERAAEFGKPVLLLQGDSHEYLVDQPYAEAPNLTRVVVEGENVTEWLRIDVQPKTDAVFTWSRQLP